VTCLHGQQTAGYHSDREGAVVGLVGLLLYRRA
jgi:hypothetical protein